MQIAMLALYRAAEQAYIERDRANSLGLQFGENWRAWNRWNDAAAYAVARADQIDKWGQRFPEKEK